MNVIVIKSSRTDVFVVVVDVTSFSALDVVEIVKKDVFVVVVVVGAGRSSNNMKAIVINVCESVRIDDDNENTSRNGVNAKKSQGSPNFKKQHCNMKVTTTWMQFCFFLEIRKCGRLWKRSRSDDNELKAV